MDFEKPLPKQTIAAVIISMLILHITVTLFTLKSYLYQFDDTTLSECVKGVGITLLIPVVFVVLVKIVPHWQMRNVKNKGTVGYAFMVILATIAQLTFAYTM